jgi:cobalt/nickel transport system permease protein
MLSDRLGVRRDPFAAFDSRGRLVSAFLLTAAAVGLRSVPVLAASCALLFLVNAREARVSLLRLLPVNALLPAVWLPVLLGLARPQDALVYSLRVNAAALVFMRLAAPMTASALTAALSALHVPAKLVSLLVLTRRYIFVLASRLAVSRKAMRQRSAQTGSLYQWRAIAALIASALVRAVIFSRKVWTAMLARGFDGRFPDTVRFRWRTRDSALLLSSAAALAASCALRWRA